MPRPFPTIPPVTPNHAAAGRWIRRADGLDLFARPTAPWAWTFPLIQDRTLGAVSREQACLIQLLAIDELGISNRNTEWGILAVTDTLPRVDTTQLTERCVEWSIRYTEQLRNLAFGKLLRTIADLNRNLQSRKTEFPTRCGAAGLLFRDYLDSVAAALVPFIGR